VQSGLHTYLGCLILYLLAYSPDLNPIEESFSAREFKIPLCFAYMLIDFVVKAYLRRHGHYLRQLHDLILALLEACSCITADMCEGWFRHAGYIL
jgi:hypothetical protein